MNIARGLMFSVGCIRAQVCHTNKCPVGVATTDPKLQKVYRLKKRNTESAIISCPLEGLFNLCAAAGIESPIHFNENILFLDKKTVRQVKSLCSQARSSLSSLKGAFPHLFR